VVTGSRDFGSLTSSGEECVAVLAQLSTRIGDSSVSPGWIVVDTVTAVEAHVDQAITTLVTVSRLPLNPLGKVFLEKHGEDMSRSWPARHEWLADAFDVRIKGEKFEQEMSVAIDCRNAIVHGAGNFTRRQYSKFTSFVQLRQKLHSVLAVHVHGTALILTEESARRALDVGRRFVFGFNSALKNSSNVDF
jgi:hypothetical protein